MGLCYIRTALRATRFNQTDKTTYFRRILTMKKLLSTLLAATMILSLAACGSTDKPAGSGSDTSKQTSASETTGNVADDPKVTLVYAEVNPIDSIIGNVATAFKEKVCLVAPSPLIFRPAVCWVLRTTYWTPSCPAPTRSTSLESPSSR